MLGGLICGIIFGPDAIVLQIKGVGCFRDKLVEVPIEPTNYRLRVGDLVWWQGNALRWEGKAIRRLVDHLERCD